MVILYWTDWFLPSIGGVEVFSARLLPALVQRGHEVTVVAGHHRSGLPDETDWDGVTVRRYHFQQLLAAGDLDGVASTLREVANLKRSLAPDLVHLNTLGPSVYFHMNTAHEPVPLLLTMHSPVMDDAVRTDTLYGSALRSADRINCNSFAVQADLCDRVPELSSRTSVVYYGMDPPSLTPTKASAMGPVILGYGRMVIDKGFDVAVRAFEIVHRQLPESRLVLVGDGAAIPELKQLVTDLGLSQAVQFTGAVAPDEIPTMINSASIVVVPSRWNEPFGLVALESALMGRPVVASRVGGLAEVVEHDRTGILVDHDDVSGFAEAILKLLKDKDVVDIMGSSARQRAMERFSWIRCVDEYERLYELTAVLNKKQ